MKKKILFLTLFLTQGLFAQFKITSVTPNAYLINGIYTNKTNSIGVSALTTLGFNYIDFLSLGFSNINISNRFWKYNQTMGTVSFTKNLYPFYFNASYSYLQGNFDSKSFTTFEYKDFIRLYGAQLTYNFDLNFISIGLDYQRKNGFAPLTTRHYKMTLSRLLGSKITIAIKGVNSVVSDGRNLFSLLLGGSYRFSTALAFFGEVMVGRQAYYFDDYTFAFFNQNETQKESGNVGISYLLGERAKIIASYSYDRFEGYSIHYLALGGLYYF